MGCLCKHSSHVSSLCYSVAEYCCPVWVRSSYTSLIDSQLHSSMRLISGCLHSTLVSWLPVLSNVAPSSLRCKAASNKMLQIIEAHQIWSVYADVFRHPPPQLTSQHPIWSDMTPVDTTVQWSEDWPSATVVSYTIVANPTIWQLGFDLSRQSWSLLNCLRTGQGPWHALLHKWDLAKSPTGDCGQQQTMSHIVDACPLTKFDGGLQLLHEAEDDTVKWLESITTTAFAKWNEIPAWTKVATLVC